MNLKEELYKKHYHCCDSLNMVVDFNDALKIAKQYAHSKVVEQMELLDREIKNNCSDNFAYLILNIIRQIPLITEVK